MPPERGEAPERRVGRSFLSLHQKILLFGAAGMVIGASAALVFVLRADPLCVITALLTLLALVVSGAIERRNDQNDPRLRTLAASASRLGLEATVLARRFAGNFEGLPVEMDLLSSRVSVWATVQPAGRERVSIRPRRPDRDAPGLSTGNPVLDAFIVVEQAPPGTLARLGDPANAEVVLRVLHGYPDWSIYGGQKLRIAVRFREAADEYTLENALRAVVALARVLAGTTPPRT